MIPDLGAHVDRLDLRVIEPLLGRSQRTAGNAEFSDHLHEIVVGALHELALDLVFGPVDVGGEHDVGDIATHALLFEHVAEAERIDEPCLELAAERAAGNPFAILGGVAGVGRVPAAEADGGAGIGVVGVDGQRTHGGFHHSIDAGNRDGLAEAGLFALDQRSDGADRRPQTLDIEQVREHRIDRTAIGRGLPPGDATARRQQGLRLMAAGPRGLASVRRRLNDQETGVAGGEVCRRQVELAEGRGIPDDADIRPAQEIAKPAALPGIGRIDDNALLAAVPHRKAWRVAGRIARGRLDLDHFGPEVGHEHADDRSGDTVGEVNDLQGAQRFHRFSSCWREFGSIGYSKLCRLTPVVLARMVSWQLARSA